MATEDISATTRNTHVAQRQLEDAVGTGVVIADSVLGTAHTPYECTGTVIRHGLRGSIDFLLRHTGDAFHFIRCPLGNFLHDFIHAIDTLAYEFLVFPTVLENMPQHAPGDRNISSRADF